MVLYRKQLKPYETVCQIGVTMMVFLTSSFQYQLTGAGFEPMTPSTREAQKGS